MESTNPISACFHHPQRYDRESWRLQGKGSWARRAGMRVAVTLLMCVCSCIPVMKGTSCEWLIQLRFYFKPGVHLNFEVRQVLLLFKKKKLKFRKLILKTWIKPMCPRGIFWEVASTYNCLATYFSSCMVPVVHGDNAVRTQCDSWHVLHRAKSWALILLGPFQLSIFHGSKLWLEITRI